MDRFIENLSEMLEEQRGTRREMTNMKDEMMAMRKEQKKTSIRLDSLEIQMAKNNLATGELRLSVMRLKDEIENIAKLDHRVSKLEEAVFRKSA